MPETEADFFREATLRICGSLEIEQALWQFLLYVRDVIPANEAYLHYFDITQATSVIFAAADQAAGRRLQVRIPWPPEFRELARQDLFPELFISNQADTHPMARLMLKPFDKGPSSVMTVRLKIEEQWLGGISLWADGWNRFSEQDLELLAQLRQPFTIALSNSLRFQEVVMLKEQLADENRFLQEELVQFGSEEVVGADFGLKGVMNMVRQVAPQPSPVLLLGETGTGKEVIAHLIHRISPRSAKPFITVNCGAIPASIMDSELFGHEKGAFTGAVSQHRGRFERAHSGTIFLDEIGELTSEAQVRLLRVLQEKEIERVGGNAPIKVDIRIIAATHRDLQTMIGQGRFRKDLYFRLAVFPVIIPPLRERRSDIPALIHYFIRKKAREMKLENLPILDPNALARLNEYAWPGNVRELENVVERAIILSQGGVLRFEDLPPEIAPSSTPEAAADFPDLDQVMARHIHSALKKAGGKVEGPDGAAVLLGINPGTLRHRLRKLRIPFGRSAKQ